MEKIKAIDPKIVVSGSADKPYYSIEYYNISDKRWHIGYGSYNLKFVKEWLNDDFEIVEADVSPVRHGRFRSLTFSGDTIICSECKIAYNIFETNGAENFNFCPHCGAKMDEKKCDEND